MANMSYCRFHNTKMDLDECIETLENRDIASEEERNKANRMIVNFLEFCVSEGIIDGYDSEAIDTVIEECKEQNEEEEE